MTAWWRVTTMGRARLSSEIEAPRREPPTNRRGARSKRGARVAARGAARVHAARGLWWWSRERRTDLLRELLGGGDAVREERGLRDHRAVGPHHRDRTEELAQVVGQVGAARVARVHRDEDADVLEEHSSSSSSSSSSAAIARQ